MSKVCPLCQIPLIESTKDIKSKSLYCPFHGLIGESKV